MNSGFKGGACRTGCSFRQHFAIDTFAIFQGDLVLQGRGNQDVARDVPDRVRAWQRLGARKVLDGPGVLPEVVQFLDIDAFGIVQRRVPFGDPDDLAAVFFRKKFGGVVTDVTEIRAGNVFTGPDVSLPDQLRGKTPCDLLDLFFRVLLGIKADAAFGSPEWNIDDGALVRHQRSQGHDFVAVYKLAESRAALDRLLVLAVFCAPALKNLVMIATEPNRKLKVIDVVTGLDLTEECGMDFKVLRRAVKLFRNDPVEVEIFLSC